MRIASLLIGIVVLVLWFVSLSLIAAPQSVQNQLLGPVHLSLVQHQILGVVLFMASMLLIVIWAVSTPDVEEQEAVAAKTPA